MYSTKQTIAQLSNESKHLSAGIHENVMLKAVRANESPTGNKFIEFTFAKGDKEMTHTEWEPKKFNNQSDEDLNAMCNRQFGRILQILRCYYNEEELDFVCDNFDELTSWVKNKLQNVIDSNKATEVKLRLKVVFNKRGFTTLPSYAKYTFVEPIIEGKPSKIEKVSTDLFERPIQADKEESVAEEEQKSNTNLPF